MKFTKNIHFSKHPTILERVDIFGFWEFYPWYWKTNCIVWFSNTKETKLTGLANLQSSNPFSWVKPVDLSRNHKKLTWKTNFKFLKQFSCFFLYEISLKIFQTFCWLKRAILHFLSLFVFKSVEVTFRNLIV